MVKKVLLGATTLLLVDSLVCHGQTFHVDEGNAINKGPQQTQPLLSGSVCRVNDALDFLNPTERAKITRRRRIEIAEREFEVGPTCHINNGDEETVPDFVGQFHKSLPHDRDGQVDPADYQKLLDCVFSNDINVCDEVPSGAGRRGGGAKLINPLGGGAHQVDGADSNNIFLPIPDGVLSEELAAQMSEVYWMALARDVPFSTFSTAEIPRLAALNLQTLPAFNGLFIAKGADGKIDPDTQLFRTTWPGVTTGPVVSQFLLQNFTIDGITVESKQKTLIPDVNYMTAFEPWLDVQNGVSEVETVFSEEPLFIRNGRDLASIAFNDLIYTEAFRAALIMLEDGVLSSAGGPYEDSVRQVGFATFGEPHFLTALAASSSSTRHAWYTKWQAHRLLRPEAYGGLLHNTLLRDVKTPLPDSIVRNTELLNRVETSNQRNNGGEKTFLLPLAVAEGSPVHPAYPSGHSINLGAFVTTLKAFLGYERGQRCVSNPVVASDDGKKTLPYDASDKEVCIDENGREQFGLTFEGELNKLASNVIIGRSHLGVHYRMDGVYGAVMGEAGAVRRLQQELGNLPEARAQDEDARRGDLPPATYNFRLYGGKMLELFGDKTYKLDGKLCKGFFTGDDFCVEADEDDVKTGAYDHVCATKL